MVSYLIGKLGSHWRLLGVSHDPDPPVSSIREMKEAGYSHVLWTTQLQSFQISRPKRKIRWQ